MLVTTTRFIDSLDSCMASKILVISIENGNLRIFYPAMSQVKPIIHPLFCELYPIGPLYSPSISRTNPINLWSCTPNHQGFYHLQYSNFFDISKISFYLPYWLMSSLFFFLPKFCQPMIQWLYSWISGVADYDDGVAKRNYCTTTTLCGWRSFAKKIVISCSSHLPTPNFLPRKIDEALKRLSWMGDAVKKTFWWK